MTVFDIRGAIVTGGLGAACALVVGFATLVRVVPSVSLPLGAAPRSVLAACVGGLSCAAALSWAASLRPKHWSEYVPLQLGLLATASSLIVLVVQSGRLTVGSLAAATVGGGVLVFVLSVGIGQFLTRDATAASLGEMVDRDDSTQRERLEAIRSIAVARTIDGQGSLKVFVDEGARGLGGPETFRGVVACAPQDEPAVPLRSCGCSAEREGQGALHLQQCVLAYLLSSDGVCAWSDRSGDEQLAHLAAKCEAGCRAVIGRAFTVRGTRHVLAYATNSASVLPFTEDDKRYVEVLAALCQSALEQSAQRQVLRYHVEHDGLTGLLSAAAFRSMARCALAAGPAALIVADVDHLRIVNNTAGYRAGDAVLVRTAVLLQQVAREGEIVARLGGDTFAILVRGCVSRVAIEARVRAFASALGFGDDGCARRDDTEPHSTLSFGIARAPEDAETLDDLLAHADAAVHAAKSTGRARWEFFGQELSERMERTKRMLDGMAGAVANEEFELFFQPHVELATGRVAGAEALLRWNHPQLGFLTPEQFLPLAEQHGLAGMLGRFVMTETLRISAPWRRDRTGFRIWFNLSAAELDDAALVDRLVSFSVEELAGAGVEITEQVAMRDVEQTLRTIERLRSAGLQIALDDFGTGYSSLTQLRRLPIDVLKIDRSFVGGTPWQTQDTAIVEGVIEIARKCGLETIAEGVESAAQASFLDHVRCTYAQGWLYGAAMPAATFEQWLCEREAASALSS